jgi:hypothetical protein
MSERDPQGGAQRPGVVIVEEHMARRLGRAAALSARWRVLALESFETLSRVQRAERPSLVLLSVDPAHPGAATRAAQRTKSALSPPRVGLLCHGRVDDPAALVLGCGADGWLGGEVNEATLNAWVDAGDARRAPDHPRPGATTGPLGAALGALRAMGGSGQPAR